MNSILFLFAADLHTEMWNYIRHEPRRKKQANSHYIGQVRSVARAPHQLNQEEEEIHTHTQNNEPTQCLMTLL